MISITFNERDWQFELLNTTGTILAALYDERQAKLFQSFYLSIEKEEEDIQQQKQQEQEMAEAGQQSSIQNSGE